MPQRERSEKTEGKTEVWPARRLAVSRAVPLTQWLTSELQWNPMRVGTEEQHGKGMAVSLMRKLRQRN